MFKKLFSKHRIDIYLNKNEIIFIKKGNRIKYNYDCTFLLDDKNITAENFKKMLQLFEKNIKKINCKSLIRPVLTLKIDFYKTELDSQMQQAFLNELMLTLSNKEPNIKFKS